MTAGMTIQRQYNLPNCTLLLEGLGDAMAAMGADPRPLMSILLNAECRLVGHEPFGGGKEFLTHLVMAVSQYVQELLSGVHPSERSLNTHSLVQLQRVAADHHRLQVVANPEAGTAAHDIQLTTVQLFDLVDAIDQFFEDAKTLPDLQLRLQPLSRRDVQHESVLAKQAVPAGVGISSVALAALALSFLGAPKVQEPKELFAPESTAANVQASPSAAPPVAGSSPSPTASASPTASPSPSAIAPDVTALTQAPAITDTAVLDELKGKVREQLAAKWRDSGDRAQVAEPLTYRLSATRNGDVVGYKGVNPTDTDKEKLTPLPNVLYTQTTSESLAQLKVVFAPDGTVEVLPWGEEASSPASGSTESPTPTVVPGAEVAPSPEATSPSPEASPSSEAAPQ